MPVRQKDAQRALELLQQYRAKLDQRRQNQNQNMNQTKQGHEEEDYQLQLSLDRVIDVFQSQLFSALLDIQEFYELTILADSKCSLDQTDGPGTLPDSSTLPARVSAQPQASPGPPSPPASGEPSQPKPLIPKPRSIKSPAPPIPSGVAPAKPSSPTTQSNTPQSQPPKVKYRAPLPPVQPGAPKSTPVETSEPSSPSAGADGVETPTGFIKTPPAVALNGTKPHFTATSSESTATSATPQGPAAPPDVNLVTVSALVSGTIQGLLSQTTPEKLAPTSTTPSTSPGPHRVTDAPDISTALTTGMDPGPGIVTASTSPTSPSQGKLTSSSLSPTGPPGPWAKGTHLSPSSPGPVKVTSPSSSNGPAIPGPVNVSSPSPSHSPASPRPATSPWTPIKSRWEDGADRGEAAVRVVVQMARPSASGASAEESIGIKKKKGRHQVPRNSTNTPAISTQWELPES